MDGRRVDLTAVRCWQWNVCDAMRCVAVVSAGAMLVGRCSLFDSMIGTAPHLSNHFADIDCCSLPLD